MARAVIVCSDCGKQLVPSDKFCPQCGARVERDDAVEATGPTIVCVACGQTNSRNNTYCESCGARLSGNAPPNQSLARGDEKKTPTSGRESTPQKQFNLSKFRFEVWHYAIGAVLLALFGYFIYDEVERNSRVAPANVQSPPLNFPSQQASPSPPSKDILDAIARLEQTVRTNPNDAGAKLLLANALHDGAIHDGSLFPRAIKAYQNYLKDKPGDPNARVDLGICYFELGKIDSVQSADLFARAINEMEATMKNNPKHQAGAFNLGIVYLYSGNMLESNKWLQKAVDLNTESDLGKRAKTILEQHVQAG